MNLTSIILTFIPVLIAIIAHELAHGWMSCYLGDSTAKDNGRLSLNPLKHIDLFGSVILPAILLLSKIGIVFGWAKPVPVNYNNFKHFRRDIVLTASAGIMMNLWLAIVSALFLSLTSFIPVFYIQGILSLFFLNMVVINILLAVFNIIPIPPLDGSKIFFGWINKPWARNYVGAEREGLAAIVLLAFILPAVGNSFGVNLNVFGQLLIRSTKSVLSLFL